MSYDPVYHRKYYLRNRKKHIAIRLARYHADPLGKQKNRDRKRRRKSDILAALGWKAQCKRCRYKKYLGALDFHHIDPTQKVAEVGSIHKLEDAIKEARKCELICANCHREELCA